MQIRYTADHEWIAIDGDIATVGITDHAQSQLADLVFAGLPEIGRQVTRGEAVAVVESVKAASDVYTPLTGAITAINSAVSDDPSVINADPMAAGWLFRIRVQEPAQLDQLLSEADYQALLV